MASQLEVVNACLETLGESPLNTLSETHEFKPAALAILQREDSKLQARGWWFNRETYKVSPSPGTGHLVLPADCLGWASGSRDGKTLAYVQPKPWFVKRGSRLYDTNQRTYEATEDVTGEIIRLIPLTDLPELFYSYLLAEVVLKFQSQYDGDSNRRVELREDRLVAYTALMSEHIRRTGHNVLDSNVRLAPIRLAFSRRVR